MKECIFPIRNKLGLHARPAALFVQIAQNHRSSIQVIKDGSGQESEELNVDGKSIMGLLSLSAECGSVLRIYAHGDDEDSLIASLAELFERNFDEE